MGLAMAGACGAGPALEATANAPSTLPTNADALFERSPTATPVLALTPSRPAREGSSAVALASRGKSPLALVAHGTEDAVVTIDLDARRVIDTFEIAGRPEQLLVLAGGRVALTLRQRGDLVILSPDEHGHLALSARTHVGSDPVAVAASPDGATLYVTCGFEGVVVALDAATLTQRFRVAVAREPRAVMVSPDGKRVYASHASASSVTSIDVEYGGTPRVQEASLDVDDVQFLIGPGRVTTRFFMDQGFAMAERGGRLYLPGAFKNPGSEKFTGGYGESVPVGSTVRSLDLAALTPVSRVFNAPFEIVGNECTLPRAAVVDARDHLYVACLGIDQVLELDARAVDPSTSPERRFDVPEGPTGVALDDARHQLVTYSSIAGAVGFVDLGTGRTTELPLPMRADATLSAIERRGRHLFTTTRDARVSMDNRACESCHPDGRDDGMTWSTPNGPRQTISLAGRISGAGHFGWFGNNSTIALHVRHTAKRLHGVGFEGPEDRDDLVALEAWIHAMPAPSPVVERDDPEAKEGERVFLARGCGDCHRGGATDDRAHDVHSGNIEEASVSFDTPSLRLITASAPYFHDGRFATLDAMFLSEKGPMAMPHSTEDERRSVSRYLASLGAEAERPAAHGALTRGGDAHEFVPAYPSDFRAKALTRAERHEREVEVVDLSTIPVADTSILETDETFFWDDLFAMTPEHFAQLGEPLDPTRDGARMADKGILRFDPVDVYGSDDRDDLLDWRDLRWGLRYHSIDWARLDHAPDGGLRFRAAVGVADRQEGTARLLARVDGPTRAVCDEHGLVLRTTCATCKEGMRDRLFLVTREQDRLRQRSISLEAGHSGRLVDDARPIIPRKGLLAEYESHRRIQIEATHVVRDAEPKLSLSCAAPDVDGGVFIGF